MYSNDNDLHTEDDLNKSVWDGTSICREQHVRYDTYLYAKGHQFQHLL